MKVLFAIGYHHRYNGAQRWACTLIQGLRDEGLDVHAVFGGDGRCVDAFRAAGIDSHVVALPPALNTFERQLETLTTTGRLRVATGALLPSWIRLARAIRHGRYDVVHCNEPRSMAVFGVAARLAGTPTVLAVQGHLDAYPAAVRWMAAAAASRISAVAAASISTVPRPFRGRAERIHIGIDPPWAGEPPAPKHLPGARVRVLQLGSYDPHKGHHHLVEAAVQLRDRLGREVIDVVMLGDTVNVAYRRHLEQRLADSGLQRVTIGDWTADAHRALFEADVVAQPTVEREQLRLGDRTLDVRTGEGTPIALLEAGLASRPSVATTAAGIAEVVEHGRTGLLVPPSDSAALADALATLAADASLRERMGAAARTRVREQFAVGPSVRRTREMYERLACG